MEVDDRELGTGERGIGDLKSQIQNSKTHVRLAGAAGAIPEIKQMLSTNVQNNYPRFKLKFTKIPKCL